MISVYLLLDYPPFKTFVFPYRLYPFLLIFTFSKSCFFYLFTFKKIFLFQGASLFLPFYLFTFLPLKKGAFGFFTFHFSLFTLHSSLFT